MNPFMRTQLNIIIGELMGIGMVLGAILAKI